MRGESLGYIVAFSAMFLSAMSSFPFTKAVREWGAMAVNHYRLVVSVIVLTILCIIINKLSVADLFTGPTAKQWIFIGTSGILGLIVGDYLGYQAMAILGARVSSIFNTIAPGAALTFGFLLLNESISLIGMAGIAISIAGVIWFLSGGKSNESPPALKHGSLRKGIISGTLAGICQGTNIVFSKMGFNDATYALTPLHVTWMRMLTAMVVYFTITTIRGRLKSDVINVIREGKGLIANLTFATLWGTVLSIVLLMWSITLCKVAVVQTIVSLVPIVVVPMSFILYKERITAKTIVAAIISVCGVFILIWREDIALWMQTHLHL